MAETGDPAAPSPNGLPADELTFEETFRQLNALAERLEAGGLTLSEAAAGFEEGMKLVQRCNHLLDAAELRMTEVRDAYQPGVAETSPPYAADAWEPEPPDAVDDDDDDLPF